MAVALMTTASVLPLGAVPVTVVMGAAPVTVVAAGMADAHGCMRPRHRKPGLVIDMAEVLQGDV